MFDLDQAIKKWRRELLQKYSLTDKELDEFSDHLRCDIEQLIENGADAEQAFIEARNKMGIGRKFSQELLSISHRNRLRRLPKPLLVMATLMIVGGIDTLMRYLWAESIFPTFNHTFSGNNLAQTQRPIGIGDLVTVAFSLVYGLGIFLLSTKLHRFLVIMSGFINVFLFFVSVSILILLFSVDIGSQGTMRAGRTIVMDPLARWSIYAIVVVCTLGLLILNAWVYKLLTRPDVKFLFGIVDESSSDDGQPGGPGLIRQPMKTFRWLPY